MKPNIIATALIATIFTFTGCGQHSIDESLNSESSSSVALSSSATALSSSSDDGDIGHAYNAIKVGNQTWMVENLDYNIVGSKCYDDLVSNCDKYGRLYDWATAMALPSKCNITLSIDDADCAIGSPHKGICPSGWHIPSSADWNELYHYADGTLNESINLSSNYDSRTAGMHLKAKGGWIYCGPSGSGKTYSCEDTFGFSALPGGTVREFEANCKSDCDWDAASRGGSWWSASEFKARIAYYRYMYNDRTNAYYGYYGTKSNWLSVRCLKDSFSGGNSSSSSGNNLSPYTDKGNSISSYKTKTIGSQTWMAENLNYNVADSKCYGEDYYGYSTSEVQSNCDKYGRLYDWPTAMALPSKCNRTLSTSDAACAIGSPHKGICPSGWHIPSNEEWSTLVSYVDSDRGCSGCAGKHLKTTSGWTSSGNGVDTYSFSALPGGYGTAAGSFGNFGSRSVWWTASETGRSGSSNNGTSAYYRDIDYLNNSVGNNGQYKYYLYSVRCVMD